MTVLRPHVVLPVEAGEARCRARPTGAAALLLLWVCGAGPCEPRAASALCETPLHLPPFGMRPHLIAGVAPQVEEAVGDRCQPDVRAPAIGTREAADGRMRLRALLPSVHVVLRIIGHVGAWLEGPGPTRLTIRPSYTYSLGVIHHAGLERITRRV
jgi:hypothetical protein